MKKVLVYSHDTYGLGNIRRMLAVVEHLVEKDPDLSVLVLSGSPMLQAFRLSPRIDYIKLPCLARDRDGQYASKFLDMPYERLMSLRADLILNTVCNFEPDLILVDKKPLGVQNELAPAFDFMRRRSNRPKLVLLLREILDDPASTRGVWERNGYHDVIRELYDSVLVVGSPSVFDTATEYGFPLATTRKLEYCGYIRKKQSIRAAEEVRSELNLNGESLVFVTAGGGKDGYRLFDAALNGFSSDARPPGCHLLLCFGPEMNADESQVLRERANLLSGVTTMDFTNDLLSYLNAAEVVLSMAGYNLVTELLTLKKPAVLVPRTVPVLEQWIRATRLEKLDLFSVIHPDQLTGRALLTALQKMLDDLPNDKAGAPAVCMDGLENVCRRVTALLTDRERSSWNQMWLKQPCLDTGEFPQLGAIRLKSVPVEN